MEGIIKEILGLGANLTRNTSAKMVEAVGRELRANVGKTEQKEIPFTAQRAGREGD